MSLLSIVISVCRATGLEIPQTAYGSTAREIINIVQFASDAAREMARRADWNELGRVATMTPIISPTLIAGDFARLYTGGVRVNGEPIRGGLSAQEWATLPAQTGTPRVFRLIGKTIALWPVPTGAANVSVSYQSDSWVISASGATRADWGADTDTCIFPEDLIVKGAVWRHKRHIGQDFSDYLAEFEAAFADHARQNAALRSP